MFMGLTELVKPRYDGREVHVSRGGIRHPKYDSAAITNDVGLVQLMGEATLGGTCCRIFCVRCGGKSFLKNVFAGSNIGTVTLTPRGVSYIGQQATVAGFGLTGDCK